MTTTLPAAIAPAISGRRPRRPVATGRAMVTITRRRFALSASTPRELLVPLLTPILFALVIAPALAKMVSHVSGGLDYSTFVAVGTVGLLVPLSCTFAGIGVIVDRESGARRELLAAPVPRSLHVLGNLAVALTISALQLVALIGATLARGSRFHTDATGVLWFAAAVLLFATFSYAVAETLANRIATQEEFVAATPAIAILPWFLAGSLFPLHVLPGGLAAIAKVLPLTHALALIRYGLIDRRGAGLHDIWGMTDATVMATLSLVVVAAYAALLTGLAIRVFTRAAVQ
jgi:ABC-2 type transport system permease protein